MNELEARAELTLAEASEYLGWTPRTHYNRRQLAETKKQPWLVPQGHRNISGHLVFAIGELKIFKKKSTTRA